ncbi:preprotein translocase subunit SecE [Synechococcus sp. HJ21-Hayes]|uniref:preprotein translocase subunit SecE n=1 Tax=unclassified Synechococcus TaxID=2626047 RepID=UPI0020CCA7A3|nr:MULTISPECIES: preprotein translocase subunit SecE [unclassified Synechococcus]MCP9830527.1 preprotein translocase subunit SecE [Synechococcus sp. JJ3a-Johnson]MCP9852283.1 preprotein translocase subunit SecE [Synechococcus sp. HJ21-Hayes]
MDSQTDPRPAADSAPSAEPAPATATSSDAAKPGFVASTVEELRKVVWPSRQQLFSESVAVILMVTLSAFAIAAIDRFYSWANTQVFR